MVDYHIVNINKKGEVKNKKLIKTLKRNEYTDVLYEKSSTNIIAFHQKEKLIEVYDFDLKLVHRFELTNNLNEEMCLNEYDLFFFDEANFVVKSYSYKTIDSKAKCTRLDKRVFLNDGDNRIKDYLDELFLKGVDEKYFYFELDLYKEDEQETIYFVVRREDLSLVNKFRMSYNASLFMKHESKFYAMVECKNSKRDEYKVYGVNSETNELGTVEVKNFRRIKSIEMNGNKIDSIKKSFFHIDLF